MRSRNNPYPTASATGVSGSSPRAASPARHPAL